MKDKVKRVRRPFKEILYHSLLKTANVCRNISRFCSKFWILLLILAILIAVFVSYVRGRDNLTTAEASDFVKSNGFIAFDDNPVWFFGGNGWSNLPSNDSNVRNYLSAVTGLTLPSDFSSHSADYYFTYRFSQFSPLNMVFREDCSIFANQIILDGDRPEFTYGDNFTERFLPYVYDITSFTDYSISSETRYRESASKGPVEVELDPVPYLHYKAEFYSAQTPFYALNQAYYSGNTNNSVSNYIGCFKVYRTLIRNVDDNEYLIDYPIYSFFEIVNFGEFAPQIIYDNFDSSSKDHTLSSYYCTTSFLEDEEQTGNLCIYTLNYNNGLAFRFAIRPMQNFSFSFRSKRLDGTFFQCSGRNLLQRQYFLCSTLVQGFDKHYVLVSESTSQSFLSGYQFGYETCKDDMKDLIYREKESAVSEAISNYNNTVFLGSASYNEGYDEGVSHARDTLDWDYIDSLAYLKGVTDGASGEAVNPFIHISNAVNSFMNISLFTIGTYEFKLSFLLYIGLGLLFLSILFKTFWGK